PSFEKPSVTSKPVELVPLAGSLAGQQKAELIPAVEGSGARNKTPVPGTFSTSDVRAAELGASSIDNRAAQRKTPVPGTHTVNDFRRAESAPSVEIKVRKTPVPGAFTTADVHGMELKSSGVEIKVRNTPVPGSHHVNDFRTSEISVVRPHASTVYSPSQHRHAAASSGGGMKWIMLCAAVIVIAAGALLAPKFLTHFPNTHSEPAAERLTTSEPTGARSETPQNVQAIAPASQPEAEPKLEIKEAQAEPKSEAKTEARSEPKPSTPALTHEATTKPAKVAEPGSQELAVVKQSGATAASHRQAPAPDEPPPSPEAGSALVGDAQPPAVLNGIAAPASPAAAPRTVSQIKAARLLTATPPVYPAIAKQNRIQGDVTIDMEIDTNGNVTSEKVLSGPPFLQSAAKDAVRRWKYEPATLNDKPIPYHIQVKVHFALQ
ncbi:MAG TPA: TonB family protein, partial [Terriglobales bacterium]